MNIVAALAGRRVDAVDATVARFPLANVERVGAAIEQLLSDEKINLLVCSAACGADLLALNAAARLDIRTRVILPYNASAFKETSVLDRPGNWASLYDKMIGEAADRGDLVELHQEVGSEIAFSEATNAIVEEARLAAGGGRTIAVAVWEGESRGPGDATAEFRNLAAGVGMDERVVSTC